MSTITIRKPALHSAQQQIVTEAHRFNVVCCGRRFGKTVLACDRLVTPDVAPYPVAYFAPTYKMMSEVWRTIDQMLVPIVARRVVAEHRLELITGGVIDMWSLDDPNAARGRKYKRVVIDEARLIRALQDAWQAVIRPTLADLRGDAWILSTPFGYDFFYELWLRGKNQDDPDWQAWQMPTDRNPHLAPDEIQAMRTSLPAAVVAQEVDAQFVDNGATVFQTGDIDAAEVGAWGGVRSPNPSYITAVDVGRRQDATVINTVDVSVQPYQRVDHQRWERLPFPRIQQLIAAQARRFPGRVYVESNGIGDPVIENLEIRVEPFVTTAKSKVQAIQALALLLEQRNFKAQWTVQERKELTQYMYDDAHLQQDCVMSLAIAAHALITPVPVIMPRPSYSGYYGG